MAKLDNNYTRAKMEETLKYAEDKKACMLSWIEGLGVIEKRLAEYFCENTFTYVDCFQFLISCDTEFQVLSLMQALKLDQLSAKGLNEFSRKLRFGLDVFEKMFPFTHYIQAT